MTRAVTTALGFTYAVAWAILGWLWGGPPTDLDYFFLPAVRIALSGHPLMVYAVRFQTVIANDNGPLGLVPLTAVAAVASWLAGPNDERLQRAFILAAFSIFTLLMTREAVAAIDRLRGVRLTGLPRVLTYIVFVASPTLLIAVLGYGHVEQPMTLWLVLFAVRKLASGQTKRAGIASGLALLTRSLAALPLIPLAVLLIVRSRWRAVAWLGGTAGIIVVLGVLPFLVADPKDTIYSLLTHRGSLPVSGGSIWQVVVGTPFQWVPQHADVLFVFGVAVVMSLVVIAARKDLDPSSRDIYGLLALTALVLPLLAKSVWPYYFLDAYVFGAIWWLAQPAPVALGRRLIAASIPIIATIGALLTEYEMGDIGNQARLIEGVAMGATLAILMTALAGRLRRERLPTDWRAVPD